MKTAIDAPVIVAALDGSGRHSIYAHALSETFSTLTGGRLGIRIAVADAAMILREKVVPRLTAISLEAGELVAAYDESEERGVRSGAIYDYLHLVAARKAGAARLCTLNVGDFRAFHRPGIRRSRILDSTARREPRPPRALGEELRLGRIVPFRESRKLVLLLVLLLVLDTFGSTRALSNRLPLYGTADVHASFYVAAAKVLAMISCASVWMCFKWSASRKLSA